MSTSAGPPDALREIWYASIDDVRAQVSVIEAAVTAALTSDLDDAEREGAAREAHKLSGSAGTFGFHEASVRARELEHAFSAPLGTDLDLPGLVEALQALKQELLVDGSDPASGREEEATASDSLPDPRIPPAGSP